MYSNAAGGVQTYNPAVSTDGSAAPMHSMPAANQQYYSLPAVQMTLPPAAAAAAAAAAAGYGAGQPTATMGHGQPQYNVAGQAIVGGGAVYQPAAAAGYQTPTQMYMPSSSAAAAQPPPQPPPQPGTAAEYQPYNMHGQSLRRRRGWSQLSLYSTV